MPDPWLSPPNHKSQGLTMPKPGARNSIQVTQTQALEPSSPATPGWPESETKADLETRHSKMKRPSPEGCLPDEIKQKGSLLKTEKTSTEPSSKTASVRLIHETNRLSVLKTFLG